MEQVGVILNPYSGRGLGKRNKDAIARALAAVGLRFAIEESAGPGHAITLAQEARAAGCAVVAAAGGDGTINEVVNGLARAAPAGAPVGRLGLLALGSGNDLATALGAERDLDKAAQRLAAGVVRRIDLGYAAVHSGGATHLRYFDNTMGLGFEAQVAAECRRIRRLRGVLLYGVAAVRTLRTFPSPLVEMIGYEGEEEVLRRAEPTLLISIANSPRSGGGFLLAPHAAVDDGRFDVVVADKLPRVQILGLLPRALFGKHLGHPAVTEARCSRLHVRCAAGLTVHMDGEIISEAAKEIEVQVEPGRLEVIV